MKNEDVSQTEMRFGHTKENNLPFSKNEILALY